jgi:hypothetical protein
MGKRLPNTPTKVPSEKAEQAFLVKWLQVKKIPYVAIMNEFIARDKTGQPLWGLLARYKSLGYLQPGVSDLFIPVPVGVRHGLWIELKKIKGGTVLLEQKQWLDARWADGYETFICKGADDAIKVIAEYLGII